MLLLGAGGIYLALNGDPATSDQANSPRTTFPAAAPSTGYADPLTHSPTPTTTTPTTTTPTATTPTTAPTATVTATTPPTTTAHPPGSAGPSRTTAATKTSAGAPAPARTTPKATGTSPATGTCRYSIAFESTSSGDYFATIVVTNTTPETVRNRQGSNGVNAVDQMMKDWSPTMDWPDDYEILRDNGLTIRFVTATRAQSQLSALVQKWLVCG